MAGSGQPLTIDLPGLGPLTVYRSDQPLQLVALDPRGLLVCAHSPDLLSLAAVIAGVATRSSATADRVLLHDSYGTIGGPIGELQVARVDDRREA